MENTTNIDLQVLYNLIRYTYILNALVEADKVDKEAFVELNAREITMEDLMGVFQDE